VVTQVRPVPVSAAPLTPLIAPSSPVLPVQPLNQIAPKAVDLAGEPTPARQRDVSEPLTAEPNRLHLTVSRELLAKLEAARLALSHARPGATLVDVIEAGLDLVLAKDAKKKALTAKPRTGSNARAGDEARVPAAVRREVWKRDGGRCQWPLASGGVCGSRLRPELDHVIPQARGGASTIDNLRVLCRAHNDLAARLAFGDTFMNGFTRRRPEPVRYARAFSTSVAICANSTLGRTP
jgi:hypothetical protein